MKYIKFQDKKGTFTIQSPENYSGLYFPLAGDGGLKSSITPNLGGDSKTDQNHFLLEPVSIENLTIIAVPEISGVVQKVRDAGLQREFQPSRNYRNLQKLRIKAFWKPALCGRK